MDVDVFISSSNGLICVGSIIILPLGKVICFLLKLFCHIEIFQNIVIRCVLGTTFVIALFSFHYRGWTLKLS